MTVRIEKAKKASSASSSTLVFVVQSGWLFFTFPQTLSISWPTTRTTTLDRNADQSAGTKEYKKEIFNFESAFDLGKLPNVFYIQVQLKKDILQAYRGIRILPRETSPI